MRFRYSADRLESSPAHCGASLDSTAQQRCRDQQSGLAIAATHSTTPRVACSRARRRSHAALNQPSHEKQNFSHDETLPGGGHRVCPAAHARARGPGARQASPPSLLRCRTHPMSLLNGAPTFAWLKKCTVEGSARRGILRRSRRKPQP